MMTCRFIQNFDPLTWQPRGICAMGGGGGAPSYQQGPPQTTTTKSEPWEGLQPYLRDALAQAQTAAQATSTTPYGGQMTAPVTDAQRQANAMRVGSAGQMQPGMAQAGQSAIKLANDTLSGAYLTPESNPYFQAGLQATIRPQVENLQQRVLPQLTADAWNAGAYGGDRYNIEQGRRLSETERNIGDTSAKAYSDLYSAERARQMQAPQLAQAGMQISQMPTDILAAAGAEQRGWAQEPLTEAMSRYQQAQQAPWAAVTPYAALLQGLPYGQAGQGTSTGTPGQFYQPTNKAGGALAGAMGGASMGSAFGPWGTAAGGILGLMGGLF